MKPPSPWPMIVICALALILSVIAIALFIQIARIEGSWPPWRLPQHQCSPLHPAQPSTRAHATKNAAATTTAKGLIRR
jgi:hypothetical protein